MSSSLCSTPSTSESSNSVSNETCSSLVSSSASTSNDYPAFDVPLINSMNNDPKLEDEAKAPEVFEEEYASCNVDYEDESDRKRLRKCFDELYAELVAKFSKTIREADASVTEQIEAIIGSDDNPSNDFSFDLWYRQRLHPLLQQYNIRFQKSLQRAFDFQQTAHAYKDIVRSLNEGQQQKQSDGASSSLARPFSDSRAQRDYEGYLQKIFDSLNGAIKTAPSGEINFLCECFAQRSEVHREANEFESALLDIDKALVFRSHSFTAITRRINLLRSLNRTEEAYDYLKKKLLSVESLMASDKYEKLLTFKAKMKQAIIEMKNFNSNSFAPDSIATNITTTTTTSSNKNESFLDTGENQIKMFRNVNGRFAFQALSHIAKNSVIMRERPSVLRLKSDGLSARCFSCLKECINSFWPCSSCSEVIYCSKICSEKHQSEHKAECGLVQLMNEMDSNKVHMSQVYNHLSKYGHNSLLEEDSAFCSSSAPLDTYFTECVSQSNKTHKKGKQESASLSSKLAKWCTESQIDLSRLILKRAPLRTVNDLVKSFFILGFYRYKCVTSYAVKSVKELKQLLRIISTMLCAATIYEYAWNERATGTKGTSYSANAKKTIGSFQCLFGSRLTHSCSSNAEWSFDGKFFVLRCTAPINVDEPITISFGIDRNSTPSFIDRQATLKQFHMLCSCEQCLLDSRSHFCLRCQQCGGPIPSLLPAIEENSSSSTARTPN